MKRAVAGSGAGITSSASATGERSLLSLCVGDHLGHTKISLVGQGDDTTLGVGVLEVHSDVALCVNGMVRAVGNNVELTLELTRSLSSVVVNLPDEGLAGVNGALSLVGDGLDTLNFSALGVAESGQLGDLVLKLLLSAVLELGALGGLLGAHGLALLEDNGHLGHGFSLELLVVGVLGVAVSVVGAVVSEGGGSVPEDGERRLTSLLDDLLGLLDSTVDHVAFNIAHVSGLTDAGWLSGRVGLVRNVVHLHDCFGLL